MFPRHAHCLRKQCLLSENKLLVTLDYGFTTDLSCSHYYGDP